MATSKFVALAAACIVSSSAFAQAPAPAAPAFGLIYKSLKDGSGAQPAATDVVRVHYKGTFPDGKEFDSSYKRGEPTQFPLNRVIKCWTEGVQKMKVGGKAKLSCPSELGYGERDIAALAHEKVT